MKTLVPIDTSSESTKALQYAIDRAKYTGEFLHVLHIDANPEVDSDIASYQQQAKEKLEQAGIQYQLDVVSAGDVGLRVDARVGEILVEVIEDGDYTEAIMGKTPVQSVTDWFTGSVSEKVLESRLIPVTVVP